MKCVLIWSCRCLGCGGSFRSPSVAVFSRLDDMDDKVAELNSSHESMEVQLAAEVSLEYSYTPVEKVVKYVRERKR